MITLNRNILTIPVYLLGNLGKDYFENFIAFKEVPLTTINIRSFLLFISSIGKKEFFSFPSKGTILFGEKVKEGMAHPELFYKMLQNPISPDEYIMPLIIPLSPFRDALVLLFIKKGVKFFEKEERLLKLYFAERIRRIYTEGKRLIREGEQLSSLLYLLNTREKSFLEKLNIIFKFAQRVIKTDGISEIGDAEFLLTILGYDLGKLFFRDEILSGSRKIEPKDKIAIVNHPYYTINLINHISIIKKAKEIIETHHEDYDGRGYPLKIGGKEIPQPARILRILDTLGALITFKPYKKKLTVKEALLVIEEELGKKYDPEIGKSVIKLLEGTERMIPKYNKYTNKEVVVTLKKHSKSKIEGKVKEGDPRILTIIINQYFAGWNETQFPPLPEDKVILKFPTLNEELQGEVIDVSYTSQLIIKVDVIKNEQVEIRRNPRVPWIIPMEISDGETHCLALTTDISSHGAQIIPLGTGTKKTFKKDRIKLSFALPPNINNPVYFHIHGEIIRYSKSYTPPFYKIIKFTNLPEKDRVLLEEFIRERQLDILFLE